jgi:hypothetical protein
MPPNRVHSTKYGLGKFVHTKEKDPETRTILISNSLYKKFQNHSKKYYKEPECYETILENLLKCYDEHNKDRYWWDNNDDNNNNDKENN